MDPQLILAGDLGHIVSIVKDAVDFVQLGALGILAIFMTWHGRVMVKVVNRALRSFDKIADVLASMARRLDSLEIKMESQSNEIAGRLSRIERDMEIDRVNRRPDGDA